MKRGFLNTNEAKRKRKDTVVSSASTLDKSKGKARAESPTNSTHPRPPLLDLHSVPPCAETSLMAPPPERGRNRFIFRHWPRDPNGKPILPSDIRGKEAGNGLDLWGATLYDFYFVRGIPSNAHGLTTSTGSKLTKVMESFGELEHAKNEIAWAAREAEPKEILAWDPAQAIVAHERRVHAGGVDKVNKERTTPKEPETGTIEPRRDIENPEDLTTVDKPDVPLESPFHPSHYPSPWPMVPFESPYTPFFLRRGIPIHLLPKKLYVHDPWEVVQTESEQSPEIENESWTTKAKRVHSYTLSLSPELPKMADAAAKEAAATEDKALDTPETVFISPQETQGPTEQPAIRAFLPKRPRKPTEVPEAHLYLSPRSKVGNGNHSIVYEAELELPRDLFCESTYCKSCLDEQIKIKVDQLKESGEWERRLDEAAKNYKGPGGRDVSSHAPSTSSVQIPPRYVGFVKVRLEHVPMETVDMVAATALGETPAAGAPSQYSARVSDAVVNRHIEYEGPVVPIYPNIQWQNPSLPETICAHQARKMKPVPRTAMFRVAAKLSLPDDPHLVREASNYLEFPAHFFQHWTGYNIIPPLHDPTPVGALVPQFFGYYTPDAPDSPADKYKYYSSILLIEHCGEPISVSKLTTDDRHECAALLFRFHSAGWLHESFAERNILRQKQHPTCSPLEEEDQCESVPHRHRDYSFRLIDFGRSVEYKHASKRSVEESKGKTLFGII